MAEIFEPLPISFDLWIFATIAAIVISLCMDALKGIFLIFFGIIGFVCFMISLMGIVAIGQNLIGWWICLLFIPGVIFWEIIKDYLSKKFKKILD